MFVDWGSFYVPKDNNSKPRGDDAHFILPTEQIIGLFDGVGGWSKKGVDAGEYARELMTHCILAIQDAPNGNVDPKSVLSKAYSHTLVEGSSTACIISFSGNVSCI